MDEQFWRCCIQEECTIPRREKARRNAVIQKAQQRIEIAIQVEHADRLGMKTELSPGQGFKQLVEGPGASRHGHDCIGQVEHPRFALVHRSNNLEMGHTGVHHLIVR